MGKEFTTVLVANRGEIACRVIRTLRHMGIRSVAVYSEADDGARHVQEADLAYCLGPAAAAQSYLNIDAVVQACRATGAQAVHPGYGFLSENVAFAEALEAAGITFIGPNVKAMKVMADKIRAKNHVSAHGVPTTPGIAEPGLSDEQLIAAAEKIGYPILIKPSAGGGGKGMLEVSHAADLPSKLTEARRVAASAFADDTLFLERLVHNPRHIEVQVLADNHGNVIHLGERECSLQRRHQKVIEEAPSPLLDAATRARIGQAACEAARSVDYSGAGTVEFLVSDDAPDEFFFMEMNTRLQVEHPVTELVTGVDLVQWQVRIAAGEELTLAQDEIHLEGHAVESRVYAENPEAGFLPQTGPVLELHESDAVRNDSALFPGLVVGADYDPMLSKVVAWAPDRAAALKKLDAALAETAILGLRTNVEYLRLLLEDPDVQAGKLDTTMIERKLPGLQFAAAGEWEHQAAAQFFSALDVRDGLFGAADGWRIGAPKAPELTLDDGAAQQLLAVADGELTLDGDFLALQRDAVRRRWRWALDVDTDTLWLFDSGASFALRRVPGQERVEAANAESAAGPGAGAPAVRSPMPGTVVSVGVKDGDAVVVGQTLLAVEAMKMEHQLTAAVAGTVHVSVSQGDLVKANQVVATIHQVDNEQQTSEKEPSND